MVIRIIQLVGRRSKDISPVNTKRIMVDQDVPDESRVKRREGTIWQRRFWEHTIRDQEDLIRHIDYIHFNPVKHGLVQSVAEWPWSSFHRYVRDGYYHESWGIGEKGMNDGKGYGE